MKGAKAVSRSNDTTKDHPASFLELMSQFYKVRANNSLTFREQILRRNKIIKYFYQKLRKLGNNAEISTSFIQECVQEAFGYPISWERVKTIATRN